LIDHVLCKEAVAVYYRYIRNPGSFALVGI
jgi:hypothetical protein